MGELLGDVGYRGQQGRLDRDRGGRSEVKTEDQHARFRASQGQAETATRREIMDGDLVELLEVVGLDADGDPASRGFGVEGAPVGVAGGFGIQSSEVSGTTVGFLRTNDIMRHELQEPVHFGDGGAAWAEKGHKDAAGVPRTYSERARRPARG